MPADVVETPTGTILVCDHAREDRGKWHVLGIGWAVCPPGARTIPALATIQWPSQPSGRHDIKLVAQLWEAGVLEADETGVAQPVAEVVVDAEVEVPKAPEGALTPPVYHLHMPFRIEAELTPRTGYLLRLLVDGEPIAWDVFTTVNDPSTDDSDSGEGDEVE